MNNPPPAFPPCSFQATTELMLHGSFIAFVIAGTHQHSYNHAALGSPTRTPKNGKEKKKWGLMTQFSVSDEARRLQQN